MLGTTIMKCLIYDGGAQVLGRHSEPIQILRPESNRVEIDPDLLWRQFQTCFRQAVIDAGVSDCDQPVFIIDEMNQNHTKTT